MNTKRLFQARLAGEYEKYVLRRHLLANSLEESDAAMSFNILINIIFNFKQGFFVHLARLMLYLRARK